MQVTPSLFLPPSQEIKPAKTPSEKTIKSAEILKRSGPPLASLKVKSRKISHYSENRAPSIAKSSTVQDLQAQAIQIQGHAEGRAQMCLVHFIACYKKAEQTDLPPADIDVWIGKAEKQDGQGDRENHAAHQNMASGLKDNFREHCIRQVIKKGLTPKKTALLKARGATDDGLKDLMTHHEDEAYVKQFFNQNWEKGSLIAGTELEDRLQATDYLARRVNLSCDLPLEKKLRPLYAKLTKKVMRGELEPLKASLKMVTAMDTHLSRKINDLQEKIGADVDSKKTKTFKEDLFNHENELIGIQQLNLKVLMREFEWDAKMDQEETIDVEKTFSLFSS